MPRAGRTVRLPWIDAEQANACAGEDAMKRVIKPLLIPRRRPETGVGEWLAAMVRGLDALEFLERSRELAAETVIAAPARLPRRGRGA